MKKSRKRIGSDLKKVDAPVVTEAELLEAPPLTKEQLKRAIFQRSGVPDVRRLGRPPIGATPKRMVTIRLDEEVVKHFKDQGAGWQSRINQSLRKTAGLDRRK